MVVNLLKRMKRQRVTADLVDFVSFPSASDGVYGGPFRANLMSFLARHARVAPPMSSAQSPSLNLLTWRLAFRVGGGAEATVVLEVVEEDVTRSNSVYCDQCRIHGWADHPICAKCYHFIIRNDNNKFPCYQQSCKHCGTSLQSSDARCPSCSANIIAEDDEFHRELEDPTHLLHGAVHANGFGHLIRINGQEGGSEYLTGCDMMSFWDRLCETLGVRKVTLMDVSKKYGMEYRLLHAVITGHSWYARWGYKLGAASFCITPDDYQKAIESLSSTPLSSVLTHRRSSSDQLRDIIAIYQSISDHQLRTVRDIFVFLTQLLHDANQPIGQKDKRVKPGADASSAPCVWPREDVERAENTLIKILRAVSGSQWVTWRALRGATTSTITSKLFVHCLEELCGKTTDGMVVAVRCNVDTGLTECRLEPDMNQQLSNELLGGPPIDRLLSDLKFLYNELLNPASMDPCSREFMKSSATTILDCKQFIKHYDSTSCVSESSNPLALRVWCSVGLTDKSMDSKMPPPELLTLPTNATVADLKIEATNTFQMYLFFQGFQAEQLVDYSVDDSTQIKLLIGSEGLLRVKGSCYGFEQRLHLRTHRGLEDWKVNCPCGAMDDDGERMIACDVCGVWQHTRCAGIKDPENVPENFVCSPCFYKPRGRGRPQKCMASITACKEEILA